MTTTVDLGTSNRPLREVIEVWNADHQPPRLRHGDGRMIPLRDFLATGEGVAEIPSQLDRLSCELLEGIVSEQDFEDFDGTEQHAADLLLIALHEHEGDKQEADRLREIVRLNHARLT